VTLHGVVAVRPPLNVEWGLDGGRIGCSGDQFCPPSSPHSDAVTQATAHDDDAPEAPPTEVWTLLDLSVVEHAG
jgi:hypothetical protein